MQGGHGFPSPRFTVDADGIVAIYCELHVTPADAPELRRMAKESNTQNALGRVAENLNELVDPSGTPTESMNHPRHHAYRLKDGCPKP